MNNNHKTWNILLLSSFLNLIFSYFILKYQEAAAANLFSSGAIDSYDDFLFLYLFYLYFSVAIFILTSIIALIINFFSA